MGGEIEGDASGLTTSRMGGRAVSVQIVERVSGRRIWTVEQKLAILGEAFSPGSSVARTVERHEINTGQLYTWRRQLLDGELGGPRDGGANRTTPIFARVEMTPVREAAAAATGPEPAPYLAIESAPDGRDRSAGDSGLIEIELQSGVRVRVDAGVDDEALRRVLDALGSR